LTVPHPDENSNTVPRDRCCSPHFLNLRDHDLSIDNALGTNASEPESSDHWSLQPGEGAGLTLPSYLESNMNTRDSEAKFIVTVTLIVADIRRSVSFYRDVLGAAVLREGEPTLLRLANIWITINIGGGPTDDKPEVFASPPKDLNTLS